MAIEFDVDRALKDGYSETQIAEKLAEIQNRDYVEQDGGVFDIGRARQQGFSDREIIDHLAPQDDYVRGAGVALKQTPALLKGVVGLFGDQALKWLDSSGLGGQEDGFGGRTSALGAAVKDMREWGFEGFKDGMQGIQRSSGLERDSLTEVWRRAKEEGDLGSLVDWAQYGLGYMTGQVAETMAVAAAGGVIGGATTGGVGAAPAAVLAGIGKTQTKGLIKGMIEKAVAKRAAAAAEAYAVKQGIKDASKVVVTEAMKKAATKSVARDIGSVAAMTAYNAAMEGGSIYGEAREHAGGGELGADELAKVWAGTLFATGVETATDVIGLGAVFKRFGVDKLTDKLPTGRAARAGGAGLIGLGGEGLTEGVQTGFERWGASKEVFSDEGIREIVDSAGLGAIGGGGAGVVFGGLSGGKKKTPPPSPAKIVEAPTVDQAIEEGQAFVSDLADWHGGEIDSRSQQALSDELSKIGGTTFESEIASMGFQAWADGAQRQAEEDLAYQQRGEAEERRKAFELDQMVEEMRDRDVLAAEAATYRQEAAQQPQAPANTAMAQALRSAYEKRSLQSLEASQNAVIEGKPVADMTDREIELARKLTRSAERRQMLDAELGRRNPEAGSFQSSTADVVFSQQQNAQYEPPSIPNSAYTEHAPLKGKIQAPVEIDSLDFVGGTVGPAETAYQPPKAPPVTQTPEFKKNFPGVVVQGLLQGERTDTGRPIEVSDPNAPLVVYHGSDIDNAGAFEPESGVSYFSTGNRGTRDTTDADINMSLRPGRTESASRADFTPGNTRNILKKGGWAMLTAANPDATPLSKQENAKRMLQLKRELKKRGIEFEEAVGRYGPEDEPSILAFTDQDTALELGRQFGQESILTKEGFVYSKDGKVEPASGVTELGNIPKEGGYTRIKSTGSVFRVNFGEQAEGRKSNVKRSAAPILRDPVAFMQKHGLKIGSKVRDIGEALNEYVAKNFGVIDRNDRSDSAAREIGAAMADEILEDIAIHPDNGIGWYSKNFPGAMKRLAKVYPEMAGREGKPYRDVFTALLAITSNGERVEANLKMARSIYEDWRGGGSIRSISRRSDALSKNVEALMEVINQFGVKNGMAGLLEEITVKEMNAALRAAGKKVPSGYQADMIVPRAALLFGPKLGAFFANLMGSHGYLTMDLWWSRTVNRIRGQLLPQPTESQLEWMRERFDLPDASLSDLLDLARPYAESFKRKNYKNGTRLEVRANNLMKVAKELEEAPFNQSDRSFMYKAATHAQKLLKKQGVELSMADIQAALWYNEKELYSKLGGREKGGIGYEEAINEVIERESTRPQPPVAGGDTGPIGLDLSIASGPREERDVLRQDEAGGREGVRDGEAGEGPAARGNREGNRKPSRQAVLDRVAGGYSDRVGEDTPVVSFRRGPNPVSVVGIHYGNVENLEELDASRFGQGAKSSESARLRSQNPFAQLFDNPLEKRAYFYAVQESNAMPQSEGVVKGAHTYRALLDNIYDFKADPDKLIQKWKELREQPQFKETGGNAFNLLEALVLNAGYDGYLNRTHMGGAVVMLGRDAIPVEYMGNRYAGDISLSVMPENKWTQDNDISRAPLRGLPEEVLGHFADKNPDPDVAAAVERLEKAFANRIKNPSVSIKPAKINPDMQKMFDVMGDIFNVKVVPIVPQNLQSDLFDGVHHQRMPGFVFVNAFTKADPMAVVGHEMLHNLRNRRPKLYNWLAANVAEYMDVAEVTRYINEMNEKYGERNLGALAFDAGMEEVIADFMGDALADPDFLKMLSQKNPSRFRELLNQMINFISSFINKMSGKYGNFKSTVLFTDLDAARQHLAQALDIYANGSKKDLIPETGKIRPAPLSLSVAHVSEDDMKKGSVWKAWFRNSKVVDRDAKPLVAYHGRKSDFVSFDTTRDEKYFNPLWLGFLGSWFAAPAQKSAYKHGSDSVDYGGGRISNPQFVANYFTTAVNAEDVADGPRQPGLYLDETGDVFVPGANIVPAYLSIQNPVEYESYPDLLNHVEEVGAENYRTWALSQGHDGIVIRNSYTDGAVDRDDWVAFHPTQVKSLWNRNPNPENEDIALSVAPQDQPDAKRHAWMEGMDEVTVEALRRAGVWHNTKTWKERLAEWKANWPKRFKQGMFDQFNAIKEISDKGYMLARLTKAADNALEAVLKVGKIYLDDDGAVNVDTSETGFLDMMSELNGEHERFISWMVGNRAERLAGEGRENNFSPEHITALKRLDLGRMEDGTLRAQRYRDIQKRFDAMNRSVMDIAEKAGLVNREARKEWEHEFYIPFYRLLEDDGKGNPPPVLTKGLVNQYAFKFLKGGGDVLQDPIQNVLSNWSHLIDASLKNQAAKESLVAAERVGAAVEADEEMVKYMARTMGNSRGAVSFVDEGVRRWFMIEDPLLLDSLRAIGYNGFNGPVMKVMGKFKRWLTLGVTVSPTFRIRNVIRDSLSMIGTNPASYNFMSNIIEGWKLTKRDDAMYAQIMAGGGVMRFGTYLEGDRATHVKHLIEKGIDDQTVLDTKEKVAVALSEMWDWWQDVGDRAENINRAALYQTLRDEKGYSHLAASYAARDVMDFSMQGTWAWVRFLTQTVPFFNARLQGLYKLGRGAAQDPRRFGIVVGATAMASIALMLAYKDDDDWKQREDWDRETFWWFKVGGKAYRIPKPFEVGAIATVAERAAEAMITDDLTGREFAGRLWQIVSENLSMNPIPQFIKPMIELHSNKSFFTGRDIESMGMQNKSPERRFRDSTSAFARIAGQNGFISPVQIDHLVRAYFGWLGTTIVAASDLALRPAIGAPGKAAYRVDEVLVAGDFIRTLPSYQSKYITAIYDNIRKQDEVWADMRDIARTEGVAAAMDFKRENWDTLKLRGLYKNAKKSLTKINQLIKQTQESRTLSADQKREALDALYAKRNAFAKKIEEAARKLR